MIIGLIYGLLAWTGITLTREEGRIAIVWLPNAFLVAILLRSKPTTGILYLLIALAANIAANALAGDSLSRAGSLALINSFEISIIWLGMRRLNIPRPDMENLRDLLVFCGIGGFFAPAMSGLAAAAILSNGAWNSAIQLWLKWAISDGLGILLLAPMIMIFHDMWENWKQNGSNRPSKVKAVLFLEWSIVLMAGLTASLIIFGQTLFPILFLVMPVVLLHAFRLGALGTTIATLQIAVVGTIFTSLELGPIHLFNASLSAQLITLQLFLFCCFCIGLPVSAALAAKDKIRGALNESNTRSKLIAQAAPIGIFQADPQGNLIYVNEGVCEIMGMSAEYLLKEGSMASFAEPAPWDDNTLLDGNDYSGIPRKLQIPVNLDDGTKFWLETLDVPELDMNGKVKGYTGVVIDITESKELEENLISARRHAEAAADSKSRFLANMSHEIRTPMNGVLGFTQLILDSDLTGEQRQQMEMILDSGNAMMRLLNDILDISKIEAGQVKNNLEPVDIRHVLNSCIKLMAPSAEQKSLSLRSEIAQNLPNKVIVDRHHLRQILLNLLGNALKFTQNGGVTLRASSNDIDDGTSIIEINIIDTGIGISPERQTAIFDPFEQAERETTRNFGGSGLGLTISQQLAVVMGGDLAVSSKLGAGTTFSLSFPNRTINSDNKQESEQVDIELLGKPLPSDPTAKQNEPAKARLLLAEDHDINQILITAMTDRLGYDTALAIDGADAVAKVDAAIKAGEPFDLVLMDVQMPTMDGFQATRMIRTSGISAETLPIIAITANAFSDDIESCLAAGMQAHIAKPVMIDKLRSTLEKWIPAEETAQASLKAQTPRSLLNGELRDKYHLRKEDVLLCLTSLVRSGTYSDDELREASDHLHKLSGTAAMFGEPDLGIKAKYIENGLKQWKIEDRPKHILVAVTDFLRAA